MIAYLSTLPIWVSGILLVALPTVLAMCGPVLIRKRIGLVKLTTNNEIAGFKFATVGVIYAVLLAFAVIVVWERFSDGESAVLQEAGAAATFYRLNSASTPDAVSARAAMTKYLAIASEQGWAAMECEGESDEATRALNDVYSATTKLAREGSIPPSLVSAMFQQLDTMTYARRTRLHLSSGIVPPVLWVVLFSGAALTITFTFFFATENLSAREFAGLFAPLRPRIFAPNLGRELRALFQCPRSRVVFGQFVNGHASISFDATDRRH